eukprot:CAMPEP_0202694076 /NCGR_PEP_ID=MMETSP1385-20130828/8027_1 /ASSEMBLY_ACC=CAM_ASM_000861 /TAXON_ID=933848 /ORGANISM="Elphidium margaritaceum" /LENGTH=629 /DNA_ID=CAMNT_0049349857 /DNA_START=22 /DNA_END=1911 /DNA_ORIENTATION=+
MAFDFAAEIAKQKGGKGGGGGSGGGGINIAGTGSALSSSGADMKKYERMKKMGLPLNSIVNKMRMDGCDEAVIDKFSGASGSKKVKAAADEKRIMPADCKPAQKMKPFHWAKINAHQIDNTIWSEVEQKLPSLCAQIDFASLDELFKKGDDSAQQKKEKSQKKQEHQVIDPKRAQNVMIGLAQIKMSEDDLLDAILKMDDKKLSVEKLRKLLPYVPTDGELQMVRDYVKSGGNINDLSKVEQFFVKMMDMVGIRERVSLWIFKSEFPSILESVQRRITMVSQVMEALRESAKLRAVLYTVLVIGNYLNDGSSRGNAFGFLMEPTLDLLDGTKSSDKRSTLMVSVVETLERSNADSLTWVDDLEILERVYKIKTNGILNDLDAIKRDMSSIGKYLKTQRRTMTKMASDWAREGTAVSVAQIASHIRTLSKSGPQALFNGCETYAGLKVGMGLPSSVKPGFAKQLEVSSAEEETENVFGKVMIIFHKKQNSKVTEVENFFQKTQQECKKLATYFGFEEGKKWEEMLVVFYLFREQFQKAVREMQMRRQKEQRKQSQMEKKNMLEAKLANQPRKEEVMKTMHVDLDDKVNGKPTSEDANAKRASETSKASAMYAAFQKEKQGKAAHKKIFEV